MSALNSIFNILRFNKKNWKAVVLCLATATVFWFFNSLNKTYTTSISFPLEFEYDQDNFIPVTDMPTEVKINVTGLGWTLLRRSAGVKVPPLLLPLERPNEVKKIVGSTLPAFFASQLSDLQINFVANDTLRLDIEPLDGRWISLSKPDLTNNLEAGFGLASSVSITPDSIFVHGPRRIVESLPEPYTLKLARTGIDESIEIPLQVLFDNDRLTVDPPYVNVSFRVEEVIEIKDSVKLELVNVPARLRPAVSVKEIRYTMLLPVSVLHSSYSREAIKATLDLKNHSGKKSKLAPTISGIPPLARIIRVDTVEVSN